VLTIGAAVTGLSFGGPPGSISKLAREVAPPSPSLAFGVLFACVAAGSAIGPLLGTLAPVERDAWTVMASPEIVALVLAVWLGALTARHPMRYSVEGHLAK
jgi:MFS family permease